MKYFTPETADRTLPLVRRIVADLIGLQSDVGIRGERIKSLSGAKGLAMSVAHAEELAEVHASLDTDQERMHEVQSELAALGVLCQSALTGSVAFPSLLQGREVRLSWTYGEPNVAYWHELDEPISKRKPIVGESFQDGLGFNGNDHETGPQKSLQSP